EARMRLPRAPRTTARVGTIVCINSERPVRARLFRGGVPYPQVCRRFADEHIDAKRRQAPSIGRQVHLNYHHPSTATKVGRVLDDKPVQLFACISVPDLNGAILPARYNDLAIWREGTGGDPVVFRSHLMQRLARGHIPQSKRGIVECARSYQLPVG